MKSRNIFPYWLSNNNYKSMVEVGVFQGDFSFHVLKNWPGSMVLVDSWRHFENDYNDNANLSDEDHEKNYQIVLNRFKIFFDRTKVVRDLSVEAAKLFPDKEFDVVYLDANHSYKSVTEELNAWLPKIKKGGCMSGHDYLDGHLNCGMFGVRRAVKDFFGREPNIITHEPMPTWIYYI